MGCCIDATIITEEVKETNPAYIISTVLLRIFQNSLTISNMNIQVFHIALASIKLEGEVLHRSEREKAYRLSGQVEGCSYSSCVNISKLEILRKFVTFEFSILLCDTILKRHEYPLTHPR